MHRFISHNVSQIQISGIRKFFNEVKKIDGAISLSIGQPDFPVPMKAKEEIMKALERNDTGYTSNQGIVELREEISKYLKNQSIKYSTDEICVTCGGSEGIFASLKSLLNKGDKVLIPDPAYPAYESCVRMIGGEVITYGLNNSFQPDMNRIEEVIEKESPKIIILSYPCNPTGAVMSEDTFNELRQLLKEKDILVLSDEMYSSLIYDEKYYSMAQDEELKERVILVGGFSKMLSMTGLRVGYVCACKEILDKITVVHQYNTSCAPSIAQWGAYAGLKYCKSDVDKMREAFQERRDYVYKALNSMELYTSKPEGAFYIFPSIDRFSMKSEEFAMKLLQEQKVALVPGTAFGKAGEGHLRISYCYSLKELQEALNRIDLWIRKL